MIRDDSGGSRGRRAIWRNDEQRSVTPARKKASDKVMSRNYQELPRKVGNDDW